MTKGSQDKSTTRIFVKDSQTVSHLQRALGPPAIKHLTTAHLATALGATPQEPATPASTQQPSTPASAPATAPPSGEKE